MQGLQKQWFAVYTKPRGERVAREHLERQGFECFLPQALNPYQRRSQRPQHRIEPLFPRYLFLHAAPAVQNMALVRSTRGVVTLVRSAGELLRVPETVIETLRLRLDPENGLIQLNPVALQEGQAVRVFDGPLAGVEGILESHCGEQRAMILMNLMGRPTSVEVDSLLLQRAS